MFKNALSNLSVIIVKTGSDGKAPGDELKELKAGEIRLCVLYLFNLKKRIMILFERDILITNLHTDPFTYNLGGGGGRLRLLCVYIGGGGMKKRLGTTAIDSHRK